MKTAVISGGAGGLGRALGAALQARGWRVIALDLNISSLEESDTLKPIRCDLTDTAQLHDATKWIIGNCPSVDLVIYNAGVTQIASFDSSEADSHRNLFEINYFSAVELARALLQSVRQAKGTHLAISSVAGFAPLAHRTAYAGSKHALEGFFKSLRSEEAPFGVHTLIAAPSFVDTNPGTDTGGGKDLARPGAADDGVDAMTPDEAARIILRGVDRRAPMTPVGRVAHLAWWINRLSPSLYQHLMQRRFGKTG